MPRLVFPLAVLFLALPALAQPGMVTEPYASGLVVTFPDGWQGPSEVDENGYPGRATYRFENTNAGNPLRGAVLHIERLTGLNPVMRERWAQGRVPYGYQGSRPIAALTSTPIPGSVGFRTERPDYRGNVYFFARGAAHWAVHVEAPEAVFERHEDALVALVETLDLGRE